VKKERSASQRNLSLRQTKEKFMRLRCRIGNAGVPIWTNGYNGPGDGLDQPQSKASLALGPDGAVSVVGASDGVSGSDTGFDYATVKYVTPRPKLTIQPLLADASKVNLTLSGAPNSAWSIERAMTFPGPWTNLGPVTIPPSGSGSFQDPSPPKPAVFYRARQ
jgi:hypothetical protein